MLFDARDEESGMGVAVVVPSNGGLALVMTGSTADTTFHPVAQKNLTTTITMDPGCAALLASGVSLFRALSFSFAISLHSQRVLT